MTEPAPKAVFLDLFGTIVFFDPGKLPRRKIGGREMIMTVSDIDARLADLGAEVSLEDFVLAIQTVSGEIAQEKQRDHAEVSSVERFRRALAATGASGPHAELAERLANSHMSSLAAAVVCPPDRHAVLRELAERFPLALVSNFDHARTARAILERESLTQYFETIAISEEVGVCKPHPDIFRHAARALSLHPNACLHVGDSKQADIGGAHAAGLRAVQVGPDAEPGEHPVLEDIAHLNGWLRERYFAPA